MVKRHASSYKANSPDNIIFMEIISNNTVLYLKVAKNLKVLITRKNNL